MARFRHKISTGTRRLAGGIGEVAEPVTETITIPGGHGAATYPITSVNGISTGTMSALIIEYIGITFTGSLTAPRFGVQISRDLGSTWVTTGTIYRRQALILNDSEGWTDGNQAYVHDNPVTSTLQGLISIFGLNAAAHMSVEGIELSPVQANATQKHWNNMIVQSAAANAVRVGIFADSGTPVLTGGTLRVMGMN